MTLFPEIEAESQIEGLIYSPEFISQQDHDALLASIDELPWLSDLKRRVQHYGYKYDYKARAVDENLYLGSLPGWLDPILEKLTPDIFSKTPDQVIVNEYLPGQGISAHIDCVPCFSDTIASLSLGSGAVMQFSNSKTGEKQERYLAPRSLVVLSGAARYDWQHSIPARKSDLVDGIKIPRGRRISLTFRNVILNKWTGPV